MQKNEKDKSLNQWLKVYKDIQKVERLDEKLNKEINRQKIRKMKNQFSKKPKSENQMLQNEKFEDLEQEEKKEEEELTSQKCLFGKRYHFLLVDSMKTLKKIFSTLLDS